MRDIADNYGITSNLPVEQQRQPTEHRRAKREGVRHPPDASVAGGRHIFSGRLVLRKQVSDSRSAFRWERIAELRRFHYTHPRCVQQMTIDGRLTMAYKIESIKCVQLGDRQICPIVRIWHENESDESAGSRQMR